MGKETSEKIMQYKYYCNDCENFTLIDEEEQYQSTEKSCEHCMSNDIDFEEIIEED